ncbi:MAG: cytidine deaminase [Parachlamydiales bacterium]|nr:cytidine deaminase [Parachlamydiales bacterium]
MCCWFDSSSGYFFCQKKRTKQTFIFTFGALLAGNLNSMTTSTLIEKAKDAQKMAYQPYSHYSVGAALLGKSGKVYLGCNVENASYGLTNCAERTAIFKAVSEGEREFEAIAIVTKDGGMPCGACRQVLNEFSPKMEVIAADEHGRIHFQKLLDQLLPDAFGPANLQ